MEKWNEYDVITRMALRHVRDAFRSQNFVDAHWQDLNYHDRPDYGKAEKEYEALLGIFREQNIAIELLPADEALSMDGVYVRDATLVTPKGLIACNMGKQARMDEPPLAVAAYQSMGLPILGAIDGSGRIEGGDVIWLDEQTCVVGRGYRTNEMGIRQLSEMLGPEIGVITAHLPHYKGPSDVFHLMSIISPLDKDLMLVYSPLMPVPFREFLLDRGYLLVETTDEEFVSMACNVLALGPRRCLMLDGNPITRKRLEDAGCEVIVYQGDEISRKGEGGPTCLTRPLIRQ